MTSLWQAAAMADVPSLQALRWNHRYHLWPTTGTARGLRDADVVRLLHLAELVARGVPEADAAALARALPVADDTPPTYVTSDLVMAARSMNIRTLDHTLEAGLAGASLAERIDHWLMPELRRIGEAWAISELTTAQEEFCSTGVLATLYGRLRDERPAPSHAPLFLVGLPPGELHEIPLLATAVLLRQAGVAVTYLGPDVTTTTWVAQAGAPTLAGVVLGARSPVAARRANDVVEALGNLRRDVPVWVGGRYADRVRGTKRAPESFVAAVAAMLELARAA